MAYRMLQSPARSATKGARMSPEYARETPALTLESSTITAASALASANALATTGKFTVTGVESTISVGLSIRTSAATARGRSRTLQLVGLASQRKWLLISLERRTSTCP